MHSITISYTAEGKPVFVHFNRRTELDPMWASLPFDPTTKSFNPITELDYQLLAEAQALPEWSAMDLSDRAPDPVMEPATDPMAAYLRKDEANAIQVSYSPTPENSILAGKTVQSALDETIVGIAEIRSQMNLILANNKPPAFYDALNDLNNAILSSHTPNTPLSGNLWVANVGVWTIVSNQAKANGTTGSLATYDCGFSSKGSFEADVTIASVLTPQGIIFRFASTTSYWRAVYSSGSGGKWMIQEIQGTIISSRATNNAPGVVVGQTYKFKVLLDGNNISFLINEQLVCSWTSINNLTATKFGIYASSSIGTLFKNTKAVNLS